MVNSIAEFQILAERTLGELLELMPMNEGAKGNPGGQGAALVRYPEGTAQKPTLAEIGISKKQSSRAQKLALLEYFAILRRTKGRAVDVDRLIEQLDTLTVAELRRVKAAVDRIAATHDAWQQLQTSTEPPADVTYFQDWVKCGKPSCRTCQEGQGHGPYWYAYWTENGKTKKKYIGKQQPSGADTQPPGRPRKV